MLDKNSMDLKRTFDVAVSCVGLVVTLPVTIPSFIAMGFITKSNPFFTQKRTGLNNQPFLIYKIKTMNDQKDDKGELLPNYLRTHFIGALIRRLKIDEIPQFINILKGEMSLIGPRPLSLGLEYAHDKKRHHVKPGMLCSAQLVFPNGELNARYLELDHQYVDNHNLYEDLRIIANSPISFLRGLKITPLRDRAPPTDTEKLEIF